MLIVPENPAGVAVSMFPLVQYIFDQVREQHSIYTQRQYRAEVTQTINTAESTERWTWQVLGLRPGINQNEKPKEVYGVVMEKPFKAFQRKTI